MSKRVLAVFIVIILISQALVVCSDEKEALNVDLKLFQALDVIGDDVSGEHEVTRIELARVFCNILINSAQDAGGDQNDYSDVMPSDAATVNTVGRLGIMQGTGGGLFSPDSKVTYLQVIKATVAFLGYAVKADTLGGYPAGYLTVAADLKLTKGITAQSTDFVTYIGLSWILKNAINANMLVRTTYGDDSKFEVKEGINYLSYYLGVSYVKGVVSANYVSNLVDDRGNAYNGVIIDGMRMYITTETMDLRRYLGSRVVVFYKEDSRGNRVLYFEPETEKSISISGQDIHEITDREMSYFDDEGRLRSLRFKAGEPTILYNGTLLENYSGDILKNIFEVKDGAVSCIDYEGDGIWDIIKIDAFDTYVVNKIVNDRIYTKYNTKEVLTVSDMGENTEIMNILGEPLSFTDIEVDDTVCVSRDMSGAIKSITVVIDTFTDVIDELTYTEAGAINSIILRGSEFKLSQCMKKTMKNSNSYENIKPGDRAKIFFDKNGEIAEISTEGFSVYLTGYLVSHTKGKGLSGSNYLKIFTSQGKMSTFELSEKILLGIEKTVIKADDFAELLYEGEEKVKRQVILYAVDERSGQINWADISRGKTDRDSCDGLYRHTAFDYAKEKNIYVSYTPSNFSFCGLLLISSGTTIFVVPSEKNRDVDKGYKLMKESSLNDSTIISQDSSWSPVSGTLPNVIVRQKWEAYGSEKDNPCAEVMVKEEDSDETFDGTTLLAVVKEITTGLDEEGTLCTKIKVFFDGKEENYILLDNRVTYGSFTGRKIEAGDIIGFTADLTNTINLLCLFYDRSANEVCASQTVNYGDKPYRDGSRYMFGVLKRKTQSFYEIEYIDSISGGRKTEMYPIITKGSRYQLTEKDGKISEAVITSNPDMYPYEDYPDMGSEIFLQFNNGYFLTMVVYNKE